MIGHGSSLIKLKTHSPNSLIRIGGYNSSLGVTIVVDSILAYYLNYVQSILWVDFHSPLFFSIHSSESGLASLI